MLVLPNLIVVHYRPEDESKGASEVRVRNCRRYPRRFFLSRKEE